AMIRPLPRWLPVVAAVLVFGATDVLELQVNVASDAVFLALVLVGLYCVMRDLDAGRPPSRAWLAAEVSVFAVACLVRFSGLGIVLGVVITTLFLTRGTV